ncbi:multiheme c-type cytochrome [Dissulfuribacter thermophilus]|nr:multiheme c-type cytochrome [Dissulfuribacter thermophilus]
MGKNLFLLIIAQFMFVHTVLAAEMGAFKETQFKTPESCSGCHKDIYQEWNESMMSKSFTHAWDEVEYFKLALPQSEQVKEVAGVKAGCIGCHSPLAFLTGDIPPKAVKENTRANEGVSCEICHYIIGSTEDEPFNFSYIIKAGREKYGNRSDAKSPAHKTAFSEFMRSPEFCATCHDEQSPYGAWVKSTYREWKQGPYAKEGTRCQDCHMYYSEGKSATTGKKRSDIAHHIFHGSHSKSKLRGAIDLALYTNRKELSPGSKLKLRAVLFNGKAGHKVPSGSSEERMLWLEVWAIDSNGKSHLLKVNKKGFPGEEFTIADPNALAYQAMGEIMKIQGFKGIERDGDVPAGSRIFRKPFFDPKGRMTICQWYTKDNTKVDYRIGPRETKIETYTWIIPDDIPEGELVIKANLLYSQVPSSVGKFLSLPEEEYSPILVNTDSLYIKIVK